jgi:hypothetical protein
MLVFSKYIQASKNKDVGARLPMEEKSMLRKLINAYLKRVTKIIWLPGTNSLLKVSCWKKVKVVYLKNRTNKGYTILLSTDTTLPRNKIIQFYSVCYRIEFFIKDTKQHTGLEDCQAVSQTKHYNHFNLSLMTVSLIRFFFWAKLPDKYDVPFSMRSIKN